AQRPGEQPGVDYDFSSNEEFDDLIESGQMLEWAHIYGHRSGTRRKPIDTALARGDDVLLEVDVQGARAIKAAMPEVITIFIAPPSREALRARLAQRASESPEAAARRLAKAEEELAAAPEFTHVVVNDDVEQAWRQIAG